VALDLISARAATSAEASASAFSGAGRHGAELSNEEEVIDDYQLG